MYSSILMSIRQRSLKEYTKNDTNKDKWNQNSQ